MAGDFYQKIKKFHKHILQYFPKGATYMAKRFEESFKLITPGIFWGAWDWLYWVSSGHDLQSLIKAFQAAKKLQKPVIIHAQTLKGKGYEIAEELLWKVAWSRALLMLLAEKP